MCRSKIQLSMSLTSAAARETRLGCLANVLAPRRASALQKLAGYADLTMTRHYRTELPALDEAIRLFDRSKSHAKVWRRGPGRPTNSSCLVHLRATPDNLRLFSEFAGLPTVAHLRAKRYGGRRLAVRQGFERVE